jgi:ATP-binding cassette subfamily F protein 3
MKVGYIARAADGKPDPKVLVASPSLTVERGDRVGLIGPNGAGKSTFLKTVVGEIPAIKGRVEFGTNVKLGYYAQAHEQLPRLGTPISVIMGLLPMGEESARNYLGRFLFTEDDVFKPVEALSGGERSRLALAMLLMQQANFLILDEPTNHLDISSRETLEELLAEFDGTILFVSHDRYFMDRIATRIWAIDEGRVTEHLGNYTDYQRALGHRPEIAVKPEKSAPVEEAPKEVVAPKPEPNNRRDGKRQPSDSKLQKSLAQTERDIARLEGKLNELSDAMTISGIDGDQEAVARLGAEYEKAQAELDGVYDRWESLSSELAILNETRVEA